MDNNRLNIPNPFKVENFFFILAATVMLLSALGLLLISRSALSPNLPLLSICPLIMGSVLLILGIGCTKLALSQAMFFFGRGEPQGLADEILANETGKSTGADAIKENLRHNSLQPNEPKGTLKGILYNWMPNLIYAPSSVQNFALSQFYNLLASAAILVSLLISWASFSNLKASAWMGLLFYCLTIYLIIRPLYFNVINKSKLNIEGLVILILIAILGPVMLPVITKNWPDISKVDFNLQSFMVLILSLSSYLIFFIALIKQMKPPIPNTKAYEEVALSIVGHPKLILDQIELELQKNWIKQIPNRRYIRTPPIINHGKSEFFGELLEESQPIPDAKLSLVNLKSVMSSPQHRWLVFLNILGISLLCAGVAFWLMFAVLFNPLAFNFTTDGDILRLISIGFALLVLSSYCFASGHILWSRIDFISQIIWIEMYGSYQSARLNYGNIINDRVQSGKNMIHIENMTIRIWVSELKTVSFGKNLPRFTVSMHALPDQSTYLKNLVTQIAINQNLTLTQEYLTKAPQQTNREFINNIATTSIEKTPSPNRTQQKNLTQKICLACNSNMRNEDIFCGTCGTFYNIKSY